MDKKRLLSKVSHLKDWMSTEYSPVNTHLIAIGDDVYHDHDFYEIVYVVDGQIEHIVNGEEMDLKTGDILFLRPFDKHIFLRTENNKCSHRDVVISFNFFRDFCSFLSADFFEKYNAPSLPVKQSLPQSKITELEDDIARYSAILKKDTEAKQITAKFLLSKLLSIYSQHTVEKLNNDYPDWLNRLLEKMSMREYYKMGLPTILSFFDYDQSYMCRVFKQYMGVTMTEYLNSLRLQYAFNQLKLTNRTVLSICQETGFSSISYFNKLFKKEFGKTPKSCRKS